MDLLLEGRRVVVTGSSRGIGYAIARRFAQEGAHLVISSRNADELDRAAATLASECGTPVRTACVDLSAREGPAALIEAACSDGGGIDIVIGNTGGPPLPLVDFIDTTEESWATACETQFSSLVRLFREAIPVLRQSKKNPAIVVVSSVSVKEPMPHHIQSTVYRAAVAGMCKHLARNYPQMGIRVNVVSPASIRTDRLVSHLDTKARELKTPLRRLGDVSELAAVVVFAASPASGFMHGAHLNVDGGYTSAWW